MVIDRPTLTAVVYVIDTKIDPNKAVVYVIHTPQESCSVCDRETTNDAVASPYYIRVYNPIDMLHTPVF